MDEAVIDELLKRTHPQIVHETEHFDNGLAYVLGIKNAKSYAQPYKKEQFQNTIWMDLGNFRLATYAL